MYRSMLFHISRPSSRPVVVSYSLSLFLSVVIFYRSSRRSFDDLSLRHLRLSFKIYVG